MWSHFRLMQVEFKLHWEKCSTQKSFTVLLKYVDPIETGLFLFAQANFRFSLKQGLQKRQNQKKTCLSIIYSAKTSTDLIVWCGEKKKSIHLASEASIVPLSKNIFFFFTLHKFPTSLTLTLCKLPSATCLWVPLAWNVSTPQPSFEIKPVLWLG